MKPPERQQDQSAEAARQSAEADVKTTADVEGAAAALHESERRSPAHIASQARAAQANKAAAEGKNGDKDTPSPSSQSPAGSGANIETMDDTQERSDTMASQVHPENKIRHEQERDGDVDENINTDPATLEETGEVFSPPGPSISHEEKTQL